MITLATCERKQSVKKKTTTFFTLFILKLGRSSTLKMVEINMRPWFAKRNQLFFCLA